MTNCSMINSVNYYSEMFVKSINHRINVCNSLRQKTYYVLLFLVNSKTFEIKNQNYTNYC